MAFPFDSSSHVGDENLFERHVLNALNAGAGVFVGMGKIGHKGIGDGDCQSSLPPYADDSGQRRQFDSPRDLEAQPAPTVKVGFFVHGVDNAPAIMKVIWSEICSTS